jgi:hypothetical protein
MTWTEWSPRITGLPASYAWKALSAPLISRNLITAAYFRSSRLTFITVPNSLKNVEIDPMENFSTGMHLTKIEKALELSVGAAVFCADPGNFAP